MQESRPTQNQRIIAYMEQFGSITQLEAIRDLGVMRLASRIADLKRKGYAIKTERIKVKTRYDGETPIAKYSFAERSNS